MKLTSVSSTWAKIIGRPFFGQIKWQATFKTGKVRTRIAFNILYKSVSFTEKQHWRPKTGKKGGFEEIEHEFIFRLEHSIRKNRTTFSDVPFLSRLPLDIDGTLLLFKTIFRYSNCFLSSVVSDGKDGHGWNLKKLGLRFSSFYIVPSKINKNIIMVDAPWWNLIDIQFFI